MHCTHTPNLPAVPMVKKVNLNNGAVPKELSSDAGYYSARAMDELHALEVGQIIAPEKTRHGWVPPSEPRGRIPKGLSRRDRMWRKLRTKRGRERYALRMQTIEPVFGQIKQGRGFRQFLLRGLETVNWEWLLICAGHNLLKQFRFGARRSGKVRDNRATRTRKPPPGIATRGIFQLPQAHTCLRPVGMVAGGEAQLNSH